MCVCVSMCGSQRRVPCAYSRALFWDRVWSLPDRIGLWATMLQGSAYLHVPRTKCGSWGLNSGPPLVWQALYCLSHGLHSGNSLNCIVPGVGFRIPLNLRSLPLKAAVVFKFTSLPDLFWDGFLHNRTSLLRVTNMLITTVTIVANA